MNILAGIHGFDGNGLAIQLFNPITGLRYCLFKHFLPATKNTGKVRSNRRYIHSLDISRNDFALEARQCH